MYRVNGVLEWLWCVQRDDGAWDLPVGSYLSSSYTFRVDMRPTSSVRITFLSIAS